MVFETNPKVSIGLCAKDAEKTIRLAIESVVKQDFSHELMEIIFVDDGSKDGTLKIMKECAAETDIRTKIFSGPWRGIAKARNTVVENAAGDYIVWLDSDEILEEDYLKKQMYLMNQNADAGIVTANTAINPDDNLVLMLDKLPIVAEYSYKKRKNASKMPGTGGTTFRTEAIREVGGFDEKLRGACEDIDAAYRMTQAGWVIVQGNSLVHESHGGIMTWSGLWARSYKRGIDCRRLNEKTLAFFSLYRMNPLASLMNGFRYAFLSFIKTRKIISFMLPFFYTLKMTAWFYGFSKR